MHGSVSWAIVQVLSRLVEDPIRLQRCGLRPEDLPLLVEKNPSIAFEVTTPAILDAPTLLMTVMWLHV